MLQCLSAPIIQVLGALAFSAILLVSVQEIQEGARGFPFFARLNMTTGLTQGGLFAFILVLMNRVINPLRKANDAYMALQASLVSGQRIQELLRYRPPVREHVRVRRIPRVRGEIAFEGVSFSYPGSPPVLRDLSLRVPAGKSLALVGPSGVGKTTLVYLLVRFYDPQVGRICIDGVDIRDLPLPYLRSLIGVVPQEPVLLNTTIRENLLLAKPDAREEDLWRALELADAASFVRSLPQGLDTPAGPRGQRLSGGQKQRIAIARALLKDPPILVMDEAVSGLDADTERRVNDAFFGSLGGRTAIVIAHRLSTADRADLVAVLLDGRIAEFGPPAELLADPSSHYARMRSLQLAQP